HQRNGREMDSTYPLDGFRNLKAVEIDSVSCAVFCIVHPCLSLVQRRGMQQMPTSPKPRAGSSMSLIEITPVGAVPWDPVLSELVERQSPSRTRHRWTK